MSRRKYILATNEIYHAYNRSVGNEVIFEDKRNIRRFINLIDYYRFPQTLKYSRYLTLPLDLKKLYNENFYKQKPVVSIFSFSVMPNHFHFLLKQTKEMGISDFARNVQNSFAKYYNLKNDRHGTLLQNPFKAKRIETDEEFIHVSRYIHLNPVTSFLINFEQLFKYPYTSFAAYMENIKYQFISTDEILSHFATKEKYAEFIKDQVDYQRKLNVIKHLID